MARARIIIGSRVHSTIMARSSLQYIRVITLNTISIIIKGLWIMEKPQQAAEEARCCRTNRSLLGLVKQLEIIVKV